MRIIIRLGVWLRHLCIVVSTFVSNLMEYSSIAAPIYAWDVQRALAKIIFNKEEFSRNLNSIVELARKSNIPIFFTSIQMLSKRFNLQQLYTLLVN